MLSGRPTWPTKPVFARSSPDTSYKYIYFNHMNMALKTTMNEARPTTLSREIMRILSDICDELNRCNHRATPERRSRQAAALTLPGDRVLAGLGLPRSPEQLSEIVAKSANDYWVVARRSEQREVYMVLHKKDATLLDVQGAWPAWPAWPWPSAISRAG